MLTRTLCEGEASLNGQQTLAAPSRRWRSLDHARDDKADGLPYRSTTLNSTRRFFARPSSVVFGASGFVSP